MSSAKLVLFLLGSFCLRASAGFGADFTAAPRVESYKNIQKAKVIRFQDGFFFSKLVKHPGDSNLVFATGGDHKVILYDLCSQKTLWTFVRPDPYPETFLPVVFVNAQGTLVATSDVLGRVFVIDAKSGDLIATLKASFGSLPGYLPQGIAFSRDDKSLFVLASDDSIMEFETKNFSLVRSKKLPRVSNAKSILELADGTLAILDQHEVYVINRGDFSFIVTYELSSGIGKPTLRQGRYMQIIETRDWSKSHSLILDFETGGVVQKFPNSPWHLFQNDLAEDLSISVNSSALGDIQIFETRTSRILEELFFTDENEERVNLAYLMFLTKSADILLAAAANQLVVFDYNSGFQKFCSQR
jgi:WD40 repeat protein